MRTHAGDRRATGRHGDAGGLASTAGLRARVATYVALMLIAMAITGPGVLLGNHFLHAGVWDQTVAGAPWLVHAVTAVALLGVLLTVRGLRAFGVDGPRALSVAAGP